MLFTVSFRLMFYNAVSKEGCDRKESVKLRSKIMFRHLKTEIIVRNRDSGG